MLAGCRATGGALLRENPPIAELWAASSHPLPDQPSEKTNGQVFIDVALVARHHPSWRLADTLALPGTRAAELTRLRAVAFDWPNAPRSAAVPATLPDAAQEPDEADPGYERPAQVVKARDTTALDETSRSRQESAASEFLNAVTKRQADERAARRESLMFDLGDEIEAAQRLNIEALDPVRPDDKAVLAMTNLRLKIQILRIEHNSTRNENRQDDLNAEIRANRKELKALEGEWSVLLRAQENARQQEMKVLLFENPLKMQAAGEEKIALSLRSMTVRDGAARDGVAASLRQRLASDFHASQQPMTVTLPQAAWHPPVADVSVETKTHVNEFPALRRVSNPAPQLPLGRGPQSQGAPPAAIEKLRAQALRESRLWVEDVARRQGWLLAERPSAQAANRTRETLRLLKLP